MTGHLELGFSADAGRTILSRQSFQAPMHLSKPYWDGAYLIVNAVNPTAGIFINDAIEISVRADREANAVFTTPSAGRVFNAGSGKGTAMLNQHFCVEDYAFLDVCPEMLIPHAGARFLQKTRIDVSTHGELFFTDILAPGRVASSEVFAYEKIDWDCDVFLDGRLSARERYGLTPLDRNIRPLTLHHENSYYASGFLISRRITDFDKLQNQFALLDSATILAGSSLIAEHAMCFKLLTADSISMRQTLSQIRSFIYETLGRPLPILRKL